MACSLERIPSTLEDGLIAYFSFNSDVSDKSFSTLKSLGHDIQFINDVNSNRKGAFFNGSSSYVEIQDQDVLEFYQGQPFTIIIIIKWGNQIQTLNTANDIISKWSDSGSVPYPYRLSIINQSDVKRPGEIAAFKFDGKNMPVGVNTIKPFNDNKWHFIVFQQTTNRRLKLYVDNVKINEVEDSTSLNVNNSLPLFIGCRNPSVTDRCFFQGAIDEIRIYNRQLDETEIAYLFEKL